MNTLKTYEVKTLLKDFADRATTHGIGIIVNTKSKLVKLFWLAIFLFLFSYMTFSIVQMIQGFLQYQTFTSITIDEKYKLFFPSVTICRNSLVSRSYLPDNYVELMESKVKEMRRNGTAPIDINAFMENISYAITTVMENYNKTVPKEPPMILKELPGSCVFANHMTCNITTDFKPTYKEGNFGNCYTFNAGYGNKYVQHGSGPRFGLSLILFVNQSDYIPLADNREGAGFTIYIHRPDTLPFLGVEGVLVAPGHATRIALSKSELLLKKAPYPSNCSDGEGILNYFPGHYSVLSCSLSCVAKMVYERCGYAEASLKSVFKNKTFSKTTIEMLKCREAMINAVLDNMRACDCPSACFTESFTPSVSSSRWPTTVDMHAFKYIFATTLGFDPQNTTDEAIREDFAKVEIFFDRLKVQRFTETPKGNEYGLLSDIGGQLGFWTGSSVFSVAEVIALVVSVITVLLHKSARRLTVVSSSVSAVNKTENPEEALATSNNAFGLHLKLDSQ